MIEIKLPELGENIENAEVSRLLVAEGDQVTAGQSVLELESEKASFPLPCPSAGRIARLRVKAGDTVSIGQTVLELEESKSGQSKAPPAGDAKKSPAPSPPPPAPKEHASAPAKREEPAEIALPKPTATGAPASAGPATRRLARELGVDLSDVPGSERGGRITREDVKAFVKAQMNGSRERSVELAPQLPDFSRFGPLRRQPLNKIARTSADRLSLAWRLIPHVTQHATADITDLETGRRRFQDARRDAGPKITMTVLAVRAVVAALKAFPKFNSSLDSSANELVVKEYYHIGIAVDTEAGLIVPVIRDADKKPLVQVASELAELAGKARERSLTPKEMEGGTFTITNLGGIGGSFFTPIINFPEVAILGIGQAEPQEPGGRLRLPLSLSYDHRVINGADGARFIRFLATLLSDPFRMLAEI